MLTLILTLFTTFNMASATDVVANCKDELGAKNLVITYMSANSDAIYVVFDDKSQILGNGKFDSVVMEVDGFLDALVLGFSSGEESVVGIAVPTLKDADLGKITDGTYDAKSDLFVVYGPGQDDFMDGSTLDCSVNFKK